jgi:phosphoribosylanthranilate isomerase
MKGKVSIKVCGMVDPENVRAVCDLAPDFIGYIFYPGSKRYIGTEPDPAIFTIPPQEMGKVGVFVNEELEEVKLLFEKYRLDLVQLHGEESPGFCRRLGNAGIPVIKAINPQNVRQKRMMDEYAGEVRYFLFDTPSPHFGGSGRKFDWSMLDDIIMPAPYLLSGGIGPDDVERIKAFRQERFFGVDVNSRFESAPGVKNVKLLARFFHEIRN